MQTWLPSGPLTPLHDHHPIVIWHSQQAPRQSSWGALGSLPWALPPSPIEWGLQFHGAKPGKGKGPPGLCSRQGARAVDQLARRQESKPPKTDELQTTLGWECKWKPVGLPGPFLALSSSGLSYLCTQDPQA